MCSCSVCDPASGPRRPERRPRRRRPGPASDTRSRTGADERSGTPSLHRLLRASLGQRRHPSSADPRRLSPRAGTGASSRSRSCPSVTSLTRARHRGRTSAWRPSCSRSLELRAAGSALRDSQDNRRPARGASAHVGVLVHPPGRGGPRTPAAACLLGDPPAGARQERGNPGLEPSRPDISRLTRSQSSLRR